MWEIGVENQAATFLLSLPVGFILCCFYDFFRILRKYRRLSNVVVFLLDVVYFIVAAFFVFCFLILRTNGEIRGYVLFGALLGFVFCRQTFSHLLFFLCKPIYEFYVFLKKYLKIALKPLATVKKFVYNQLIKIKRKNKKCRPKKSQEEVSC